MQDVTVLLQSIQQVDDQKETLTVQAVGHYHYTPGKITLTYTEHTPEEGNVTTRITLIKTGGQAVVTIDRQGRTANTLTIERGVVHQTNYTMGPCTFLMEVKGKVVDATLNQTGGTIKLCYDLCINGTPASKNTMKITILK